MEKVVRKLFLSLPVSSRKNIAVISGLVSCVGIKLECKMTNHMHPSYDSLESLIYDFFFKNDIVYIIPGLTDEMVILIISKNTGEKRKY